MKQTITFESGPLPETLAMDYYAEMESFEAKLLGYAEGKLQVDYTDVPVAFTLMNDDGESFGLGKLGIAVTMGAGERFSLSRHFPFRYFAPSYLRQAYVFLRTLIHRTENAMILALPAAPFYGLTQNFDFRADVPKEVLGFEAFRRSIIVRRG